MTHPKVGLQIEPQRCTVDEMRTAWREADELGFDSIWTWDHFFSDNEDGRHYEGWTLLTAMACDTRRAEIGVLVSCNSYRNPDLLADMARTVDHISGGRVVLGIGAGWCEADYVGYGYPFGTAQSRAADFEEGVRRIRRRLELLDPPPMGPLPLLVGGEGERVTLRVAAEHADAWSGFGPVDRFVRKSRVLDEWCARLGRDPASIERSVLLMRPEEWAAADDFVAAGAQHLIVPIGSPFDLGDAARFMREMRGG